MATTSLPARPPRPHYGRVLATFFRNSLVREMAFRGNFLIEVVTNAFWFGAQLVLFTLNFGNVREVNGWNRHQFFAFMATGMIINTLIEAFFMPNCANFSELIRTGGLDFALLKPIDTQFLVSFEKIDLARCFTCSSRSRSWGMRWENSVGRPVGSRPRCTWASWAWGWRFSTA